MLFNAVTVLGLIASASAAPSLTRSLKETTTRSEVAQPAARGLTWTPRRSLSQFGNSFNGFGNSVDVAAVAVAQAINILQLQQQVLDQIALAQEIALSQAIQLQLQSQLDLQIALDNIRINTFNNLNPSVNTIAVVVTQVVDSRDVNNINTRYLVRQVQSNPLASQQAFVVINEIASLNIGSNLPAGVIQQFQSQPTGVPSSFAAPAFNSYTPGAALGLNVNGLNLLPFGVAAPSFANAIAFTDPAVIVQPAQQAAVQVINNQNVFLIDINAFAQLQAFGVVKE